MANSLDGTTIGIFTIVGECERRDVDGHKLYNVRCNQCGWEGTKRLHDIKRARDCHHVGVDHTYVVKNTWKVERIGTIFKTMKNRCYNMHDKNYRWYGAKGIRICAEWLLNPNSFEEWALNNGYKNDLTIDRIDSNKGYFPENCRWISLSENSRRASANFIQVDGMRLSGKQWANKLNLGCNTINKMIRKYPIDQVKEFIHRRLDDPNKKITYVTQSWMNVYGLE